MMRAFEQAPFPTAGSLAARLGSFHVPEWPEFPGRREKCREFRRISPFLRKSISKTDANTIVYKIILYADEQGIFLPAQGIIRASREQQGICREIDRRAPTHPIASRVAPYPSPADVAESRLVRAEASIDSRGIDRLERSAATLSSRPMAAAGRIDRRRGEDPGALAFGAMHLTIWQVSELREPPVSGISRSRGARAAKGE